MFFLIWQIITSSRSLPSSKTRYIAAQFTQDYFEPAGTSSRDFILGGGNGGGGQFPPSSPTQSLLRLRRSPLLPGKQQQHKQRADWLLEDGGRGGDKIDDYSMVVPLADSAVVLDNKPLETGQVYSVSADFKRKLNWPKIKWPYLRLVMKMKNLGFVPVEF